MRGMIRSLLTAILLLTVLAPGVVASDREAVEQALVDYVRAIEEARPEWIDRSVHPNLTKFGYYRATPGGDVQPMPMDFASLRELARTFKGAGNVPENPTHSVEVFEGGAL